jgi:hypothetical protein
MDDDGYVDYWQPEYWTPSLNALDELCVMLQNIRWYRPLADVQAKCFYDCASFVRAGLVDNPFDPTVAKSSLDQLVVELCDAVLDWVPQPEDFDRIDRLRAATERFAFWGDDD